MSALSYGAWVTFGKQVDVAAAERLLGTAYDAGVNFFDNVEACEGGAAEEVMGKALEALAWDRSSWCVSSKVFWGGEKPTQSGLSRKHVVDACHAALKRLRVDYLDLYLLRMVERTTFRRRRRADRGHYGGEVFGGRESELEGDATG